MTDTIEMAGQTQKFFQGVSAGSEVTEAHADTPFVNHEQRTQLWWFYVGALAAGKYGCKETEEFSAFLLGAQTRAPQPIGKKCGTCGDAVTFEESDGAWVGSDGEIGCPRDLSALPRLHGPIIDDKDED